MFDNNFNSSTNAFVGDGKSRLLIVSVDETEKLATLVWELELEDQTCIYGDNDRLPTGNLLASAWPSVISADASFQYDARAFEVVRETKRTAWEAFVIGERDEPGRRHGCVRAPKGAGPTAGRYSVERFCASTKGLSLSLLLLLRLLLLCCTASSASTTRRSSPRSSATTTCSTSRRSTRSR